MDENNSKEIEEKLDEENIENPQDNEEIKVEKNIEKKIEKNIERNKVIEKTVKQERSGKKDKKKDNGQVYIQYRKPSVFSAILLIIIGALIATIVLLCLAVFVFKIDLDKEVEVYKEPENEVEIVENEDENEPKTEIKDLDLSIDSDFVKSLYGKIPINYFAQEVYSYYRTTQAVLTGNQKMLFILENMRKENQYEVKPANEVIDRLEKTLDSSGNNIQEVYKYDIKFVEELYKSVFGSSQQIIKEDIETNMGYVYEYDKQDDCFYGHSYSGGGAFEFVYENIIDSIDKNEDGTEIYIYDYYIKTDYSSKPSEIYTYSTVSNSIATEEEQTWYYDEDNNCVSIRPEIINKYKENGLVKFKHTFKLDTNGNYYWYSCEPCT